MDNLLWDGLSMRERAAYIRDAVSRGIYDIDNIRLEYNEFKKGGNTLNPPLKYIYDELPRLLREAGLDVKVSSGYRRAGAVGTAGNRSWHPRHGAVDIVPLGDTTFDDIEDALHNNPVIRLYMLSNNFGLLDKSGRTPESRATMLRTGATGPHFHIGKDSKPAAMYRLRVGALQLTDGNKTVYFSNPFMPIPLDNVLINTPIVLEIIPSLIQELSQVIQEPIAFEGTIPEVVVTPNRLKYIIPDDEILSLILGLIRPYTPIEIPKSLTASERIKQLNNDRITLLLRDLEDNIIRNNQLGIQNPDKLRRDAEDLRFYRNMSALGGNKFGGGGFASLISVPMILPRNTEGGKKLRKISLFLPIVGTAVDAEEAIYNPTQYNIGKTVISAASDLFGLPLWRGAKTGALLVKGGLPTTKEVIRDVKSPWTSDEVRDVFRTGFGYGLPLIDTELNVLENTKAEGGNLFPKGGPMIKVNPGDRVFTDLCALWSNSLLRNNGYLINGNAWNLGNVDLLYNGFEGLDRPENYDSRVIADYNHKAADNVFKNFDSKTLDTSKPYVVNMFYNNSPSLEEAYNNGKGVTGTHTGVLTFDPETKRWWVTHNIHGNIHLEPFVSLLNGKGKYGVTAIYAPRKNTIWNRVKGFFGFADGGLMNPVDYMHHYDGTTEDSQQMNIVPSWDSQKSFYEELAEFNRQREFERQAQKEAVRKYLAQTQAIADKRAKDYMTTSNDAIYNNTVSKNSHLHERAIEGAKAHAAWEKEHPNLAAWSYLPSAAVIGTALAPLGAAGWSGLTALGDAAAATSVGLGITNFLTPLATTSVAGATIPQWVNLGLTSGFGAHGVQTAIDEGGVSPMTALEVAPLGRLARPMWNAGKETAYNIADRYIFMPHQNSFTRGIGITDAGLQDAVNTGVFRGNPRGTEYTAKQFTKGDKWNRDHFKDIMNETGIDDIASKFQSRTLSEEEFNAIKEASKKYVTSRMELVQDNSGKLGYRTIEIPADPLEPYPNYASYKDDITKTIAEVEKMPYRVQSGEVKVNNKLTPTVNGIPHGKPIEERFGPNSDYVVDGHPMSYWYPDGRNPIAQGHAYAKSNYGVRVNNPEDYLPFMHELHLHPSFFRSPKFADPNVEIFGKGPLGITVKLDKETLQPVWKRDLSNMFLDGGDIPYNYFIDEVESPMYRTYMMLLATNRARAKNERWSTDRFTPEDEYNHIMNDSTYNYRRWYNIISPLEKQEALNMGVGHWEDKYGKTYLHPTFSVESPYSGYVNPYNPHGIVGGTWHGEFPNDVYEFSDSLILNNWPINNTLKELAWSRENEGANTLAVYNGGTMLPEIIIYGNRNRFK